MKDLLQYVLDGLSIGSVYALVALGFVLIFRATNVVNFAQGEFSMVAAYLMVVFAVDLGWPYWLSFLLALARPPLDKSWRAYYAAVGHDAGEALGPGMERSELRARPVVDLDLQCRSLLELQCRCFDRTRLLPC